MKTEQLLLIIGAAFLLFRNRQTTLTLGNTNQGQNLAGGASGQPGNTGSMFGGGTAGGGPTPDRGSVFDRAMDNSWDAKTKPVRDAIGNWLCTNVSSSLPGC